MRNRQKFNRDECFAEALKYTTRSAFFRGSQWAYVALQRRGLLDAACSHMEISPVYIKPKWTHQSVLEEAAKYSSRSEFKQGSSGAHGYALKHGILDLACHRMPVEIDKWHMFELKAAAMRYTSKHDFITQERSAYQFCLRNGLIDIVCSHMKQGRKWTKESVMAEARKHQSVSDFFSAFPGAYKHADRYGYWAEACSHMEVKKRPMNKDMAIAEAKKYMTRADFQERDGGAYVYARKNGFLDEACGHMVDGENGFNTKKPGFLYCIEFIMPCGERLYKVGITNRRAKARLRGIGLHRGIKATVLREVKFERGADARAKENEIHKAMAEFRYRGDPFMENGGTEVFSRDATIHFNNFPSGDKYGNHHLHTP